jgi:iron complex outermembrane receptor protein
VARGATAIVLVRVALGMAALALLLTPVSGLRAQSGEGPLARPLTLELSGATVDGALRTIAREGGVRLSYSIDLLPPSVRITFARRETTVGDALRETLRGTGLGTIVSGSGHIVVLRAPLVSESNESSRAAEPRQAATESPVVRSLDRVVVMGTPAAGATERGLTVALSVVTTEEVRDEPAPSMAELFRNMVPGIVAWDLGVSGPVPQVGSVRGSSSFSANYLKTYIDGVEIASPYLLFAIDPDAIERLEVIRGPQGSAMYGSDAISGVSQIVTEKGTIGSPSLGLRLSSALGAVESSYFGRATTSQRHAAEIRGGASSASWRLLGTLSRSSEHVAGGGGGSSSVVGGGRAVAGPVLLEATARASSIDFSTPLNPDLARALGVRAAPRVAAARPNQGLHILTLGMSGVHALTPGTRQSVVVGYDRNAGALVAQRNPASVADALLGASDEDAARSSARYSLSSRVSLGSQLTATLTGGAEWSRLTRQRSVPDEAIIGAPSTGSSTRRVPLYVDTISNTGAFAQAQLDVRGSLFLVAGLRGEQNSSFGAGYGTAWSPAVGASFVRDMRDATLKLRAAYGKGIRPPPPSARVSLATRDFRQLPNLLLAPESQSGIEAGAELYSSHRFGLSLTGFDQRVEGLIQHVLRDPRIAPRVIQYQNVGRITNRGIEFGANGAVGNLDAELSLSTVASRVAALSPSYTGDLRVGDRVPEVPAWTGSGAIHLRRRGLILTAGINVLGEWMGYDWLAYYTAASSGDEAPSLRAYSKEYAPSVRPRVGLTHDAGGRFSWFVRVENLGNNQRDSRDNLQITAGRTTWLGARFSTR